MTTYYGDSSALVKRYVNETGSNWVQSICIPTAGHIIALSHIGLVEISAALGVKHRQNILDITIYERLLKDLKQDGYKQYWLIDVTQEIVITAIELTRQYKLRGYDAVHLASAHYLRNVLFKSSLTPPVFLSADNDLLTAAQAEGFLTENPNELI